MIGTAVDRYNYQPRSVIGDVERSPAGNVVLRVGCENHPDAGWHQTEHVVLVPDEAHELIEQLYAAIGGAK